LPYTVAERAPPRKHRERPMNENVGLGSRREGRLTGRTGRLVLVSALLVAVAEGTVVGAIASLAGVRRAVRTDPATAFAGA
jgi:hypothetical protein